MHDYTVLEHSLVEGGAYYFAYIWVHSILNLKKIYRIVRFHQSLEKTLIVVMLKTNRAEYSCRQLLRVTD